MKDSRISFLETDTRTQKEKIKGGMITAEEPHFFYFALLVRSSRHLQTKKGKVARAHPRVEMLTGLGPYIY
jgi:hypothetical protein